MNRFSTLLLATLIASACSQRHDGVPVNGSGGSSGGQPASTASVDAPIRNPGFENGSEEPWTTNVHADPDAYEFALVSDTTASGSHALRIRSDGREPWGGIMQYLSKPGLAGKRVLLSAAVKAENMPGGIEFLAVFRGTTAEPFEHTFSNLGASFDWQRIEQEFDVPAHAGDIEIGIMQRGAGTLWIDDVSLVER